MKKAVLSFLVSALCSLSFHAYSQSENKENKTETDTTLLGLPGDNLDLYAVLDLFQKSKTIEEFEKTLNLEETKINNLDLDLNGKVDFIKVETKKNGDDFTFILQVDVSKTEKQDVAVILLNKDKDKKVTMQIVGDKDLYGKDYIVELKESKTPSSTPNPGYKGNDPDTVYVPATTTTVVVQQAPIVQYVYSPAYVPYVPPYYYGYYPPYFFAFSVMTVSMYWGHHAYYHHGGYYGYHGNTTIIHNTNNYNIYNSSRNTSNTVKNNVGSGKYDGRNNASTRPATGAGGSGRPSTGGGAGGGTRPSTQPSTGMGGGAVGGGTRPSTQPSTGVGSGGGARPSTQPSTGIGGGGSSARPSTQPSTGVGGGNTPSRPSTQPSTRSSGGSSRYSGGSGGGSRGGSYGGGGSRGGGGRGGGGRR